MTTVPTYLLWVIGAILPLVALLIGAVTVLVNRTTTRREHALELRKWAGERAVEPDNLVANRMGMRMLEALSLGAAIGRSDKDLLWANNQAALAPTTSA